MIALILLSLIIASVPSAAAESASWTGVVAAPTPTTIAWGVGEALAPCDDASELNGVDGFWVDATGISFAPTQFMIETQPVANPYVSFYDASCKFIEGTMYYRLTSTLSNAPIVGPAPAGLAYAYVGAWAGAPPTTMTLTLSD